MRSCLLSLLYVIPLFSISQNILIKDLDSLYREDQIYFGFSYNSLTTVPEAFVQTNFSPGFTIGAIRDFPINSKRNIALGIGLGYALNIYAQNLKISTDINNVFNYELQSDQNYKKNRFSFHAVEIPFEFRWRTSNAQTHKFWRIYTGFKASYIFSSSAFYQSENQTITEKDLELRSWQYGLTLSAGYNNWNAFIYYGLNPIFDDVVVNQSVLNIKTIKVGLIFYIL